MRDTLMSKNFFDEMIELTDVKGIQDGLRHIAETVPASPKHRAQFLFSWFSYHYEILLMRYSRGDDLKGLRDYFPEVIKAWEWAHQNEIDAFTPYEIMRRKQFDQNLDFYVICLWMVSLGLCLKIDDRLFQRMLALCGNEGRDWLFETLAGARIKGRQPAAALCYPKTYQLLKFAIEADEPGERDRLMNAFLLRWYASLSKTYWHDNHNGVDGGGYFGYWCFEAAGAANACGLDDHAWRELPHYPKDLAAFGT